MKESDIVENGRARWDMGEENVDLVHLERFVIKFVQLGKGKLILNLEGSSILVCLWSVFGRIISVGSEIWSCCFRRIISKVSKCLYSSFLLSCGK